MISQVQPFALTRAQGDRVGDIVEVGRAPTYASA